MPHVNPGCAGERFLLLAENPKRLLESYNDVATVARLAEGWVDVTGVPEYEDQMTHIRDAGSAAA
jgi:hypothetical protein